MTFSYSPPLIIPTWPKYASNVVEGHRLFLKTVGGVALEEEALLTLHPMHSIIVDLAALEIIVE
jgi:hypothetical protein